MHAVREGEGGGQSRWRHSETGKQGIPKQGRAKHVSRAMHRR
jgi:hypothetical protein